MSNGSLIGALPLRLTAVAFFVIADNACGIAFAIAKCQPQDVLPRRYECEETGQAESA